MKQKITLVFGLLFAVNVQAQEPPTGALPAANTAARANAAWYRGGNTNDITNNIFGTLWNSPIYTRTNGLNRSKLNGTFTSIVNQYNINGYTFGNTQQTVNTSGYMLIGIDGNSITDGLNLYNRKGAFSLLHLNGATASNNYQEFGFRPWMKTGVTFTGNRDLSYMGLRALGNIEDVTETTIAWSDNNDPNAPGPDDMVFRFTSGGAGTNIINTDFSLNGDYDGLHVSRFTGSGLMGLGNTFGVNVGVPAGVVYNNPQSLLHMSYQYRNATTALEPFGFMQITYRRPFNAVGDTIGQGELATDGLRLGIDNDLFNAALPNRRHLNSYLRWQEASSFIIQTEDDLIPNIQANERMRITSIGALRRNHGPEYVGLPNPSGTTRIGISQSGANPLTRPMSLLHLGYNYNTTFFGIPFSSNGWRPWMDLGMLTSNSRDHIFIGLKPRDSLALAVGQTNDKLDAVIAWGSTGENLTANPGPDVMRFIFTSDTIDAIESDISKSYNGLEVMRLFPSADTTTAILNRTYGRVGIGDFTSQGVNEQPTHKLDVVGNGRFRGLPDSLYLADSSVNKIVMVDTNGVLRWADFAPTSIGAACSDTINGKLQFNTKVDLNDYNFYFVNKPTTPLLNDNRVGVGYECTEALPAKFSTRQQHYETVPQNTTAGYFLVADTANNGSIITRFTGVAGDAVGMQPPNLKTMNRGGAFFAKNAQVNYGVFARAERGDTTYTGVQNIGGQFEAFYGSQTASGIVAQGSTATQRNIGVSGVGTSPNAPSTIENIGGQFTGAFSANNNMGIKTVGFGGAHAYGIYASASGGTVNHAGYFVGNVEGTGTATWLSDQQFKTNVSTINSGLDAIIKLRPVKYQMDATNYPQFNFDGQTQFGFIAQEVETVFPNLVYNSEYPAQYDSLGNEIAPAIPYKSLNYNGLISLNTKAIIDLNQKVEKATLSDETIKTNVQDLDGSLDKVLAMRGVSYDWNHNVQPQLNLDSVNHVGFIAQEIAQVDARLTYLDGDSLLHVEYDKVVPILAEAIEELNNTVEQKDSIINDLNNRLTQLENCLSGILPMLCQMSQSIVESNTIAEQEAVRAQLSVQLSNRNSIVLDQNVPNPFAEQTVINFSIPTTVQKAQIHFYDGMGKLIQSVEVVERGLGSLTVFGSDLSQGTYTYTLVADGQIVSTKKMMKQ
jgi:Chaperone of endosialidase